LRIVGTLWRWFCLVAFSWSPPRLPGWLGWRRHWAWFWARLAFALRDHDLTCPFRLLRRNALDRVILQSDGPFAHVELLAKATFLSRMMAEPLVLDVKPGPYRGDAAAIWKEAKAVFNKPEFGKAEISVSASES
jgi:hypothetical protein